MKFFSLCATLLLSLSVYAQSPLAKYCDDDPTGELYSASWDANPYDFLVDIDLKGQKYRDLIDKVNKSGAEINGFGDYVRILKADHPEIGLKYKIWELETCINEGYHHLH